MSEDDTWMNPSRSVTFTAPPPKHGTYYVIERKKATPVSGNVGAIYHWDTWQEFQDKDKRDTELKRLRETTTWQLRGRVYNYINGMQIGPDPTEHMDF